MIKFKKIFIIGILIYLSYVFIIQQKQLSNYNNQQKQYSEKIEIEISKKEELLQTKANAESIEYIEKIAREKLNMYLPNEQVYKNIGN